MWNISSIIPIMAISSGKIKVSISIERGGKVVELTPGDIAKQRFLSRAVTTDSTGSVRIDGVEVTGSELPAVIEDISNTADKAAQKGIERAVVEAIEVEEWTPQLFAPITPRKNIQIFRDRNRAGIK